MILMAVEVGTGLVCVRVRRGWVPISAWLAPSWRPWGMLRWAWVHWGWPATVGSDATMIVRKDARTPTLMVWTFADGHEAHITHAPIGELIYRIGVVSSVATDAFWIQLKDAP